MEQPPKPQPESDDGLPAGRPPSVAPATIRLCLWMVYLVRHVTVVGLIRGVSRLLRRPVIWFLLLYLKVYGVVFAITGGRVEENEYDQRLAECAACPGRIKRPPRFWTAWAAKKHGDPPRSRLYCGPCDCPEWWMAELRRKNRWKRHYCPEERHTRTEYPEFITISPSGCGQQAFKIPGGRAHGGDDA